jgi:hypothetical protein
MNRQIISALVAVALVGTIQANEQVKISKENQELLQGREVSKKVSFDAAKVEGHNEFHGIIVVNGGDDAEDIEVKLNRSFRDNLSENVDKESIARMSE